MQGEAGTVEVVDQWTGQHACALQTALRETQDEFAARLGVGRRTVAMWHERPDVVLQPSAQRELDKSLDRLSESQKIRFVRQLRSDDRAVQDDRRGVALTVAIAVVVNDGEVLVVCRRDSDTSGISWQFPAGIVKPGTAARTIAIRETLAETGVHCVVRESLGSRVHPLSGVSCDYFLCDYLAGSVENKDTAENVEAMWAPSTEVTRFIKADTIFPPVLRLLEGTP
jgi:8-oxo-dGTP pyrophosphatase MutT (NUDIX family)